MSQSVNCVKLAFGRAVCVCVCVCVFVRAIVSVFVRAIVCILMCAWHVQSHVSACARLCGCVRAFAGVNVCVEKERKFMKAYNFFIYIYFF